MARGWGSKMVADQIEEGKEPAQAQVIEFDRSPEARMLRERLESLRLSRSCTLAQLERASNPAHREVLQKGLQALEKEIEATSELYGRKSGHGKP
jgi:hypothetical protein